MKFRLPSSEKIITILGYFMNFFEGKQWVTFWGMLSLTMFLTACGSSSGGGSSPDDNGDDGIDIPAASLTAVLETNALIAFNAYSDSLEASQALLTAINAFVADPTEPNLTAAKTAWLAAREPYGQTEAYRFRLGPIDSTDGINEDGPEGRINAWPLAEALIDYVAPTPGAPDVVDGVDQADVFPPTSPALSSNAIADAVGFPTIDKDTIATLNEADGDEANVATGYHAIEFLLWGQDLYNDPTDVNIWTGENGDDRLIGGGFRPVSDYNTSGGCTSGAGSPQADSVCTRRGQYVQAAAQLLVDDLQILVDAWDPDGTGNHYEDFVAGGESSLAVIFESMGRLGFGELAGERMNIALEQDSQEDEHSCFSDNTHRDIVLNEQGIVNSYYGTYLDTQDYDSNREIGTDDGMGIDELLREVGLESEASALEAAMTAARNAIGVINAKAKAVGGTETFDMQIAPGNATGNADVRAAIDALVEQTNAIQDVINALDLEAGDLKQDTEEPIEP